MTWMEKGDAIRSLDSLRHEGKASEFILVLTNMNNYFGDKDYRNGHAVNAVRAFWTVDGEVERHFVDDVVNRVDSLFRTRTDRSGRAIAGMSNGALQALYLSATYPGLFGYVGLFSPYTYPSMAAIGHPDIYAHLWKKLSLQFNPPPEKYAIYIGKTDFFYPHISLYDARLTRKGYPHTFTPTSGGHDWYNWKNYLADFYTIIFRE